MIVGGSATSSPLPPFRFPSSLDTDFDVHVAD
jgi:hypothetical protein